MMDQETQQKLLRINLEFYDQNASSFSATRGRVQPGVGQMVPRIGQDASILDVGCGNGTLARALIAGGFCGRYLGLDMSTELLAKAADLMGKPTQGVFHFRQVDLSDPAWVLEIPPGPYDWLVCFAVLHHLPGEALQQQVTSGFARLVSSRSSVALSVWQWQNSPRLRQRVLPWEAAGLKQEDLEPGDVLLDWRAGDKIGLRYVHTFDEAELSTLAHRAGFRVVDSWFSDGKPGNLALYQRWQLAA